MRNKEIYLVVKYSTPRRRWRRLWRQDVMVARFLMDEVEIKMGLDGHTFKGKWKAALPDLLAHFPIGGDK